MFPRSNLSIKKIEEAYKTGKEKIGIDLTEDICADYEDSCLTWKDFKLFIDNGFLDYLKSDGRLALNKDDLKSISKMEDISYLDPDFFAKLYLFTVYVGNEEFKYDELSEDKVTINIGGYGLFE